MLSGKSDRETKALLSTLWIFVLLNILFRDLLEIIKPEILEEALARGNTGLEISEWLYLLAAVLVEIPIAMVIFSRLLRPQVNAIANLIAGTLMIILIVGGTTTPDLDDVWYMIMEVIALTAIIITAWRWQGAGATVERQLSKAGERLRNGLRRMLDFKYFE